MPKPDLTPHETYQLFLLINRVVEESLLANFTDIQTNFVEISDKLYASIKGLALATYNCQPCGRSFSSLYKDPLPAMGCPQCRGVIRLTKTERFV